MKAAKVTWVFSEEGEVGFQNGREVSVWTAEGHHRPDGKNWVEEESDEKYYVEPNLWTGIGLARSGCGAAIVGNPDQVVAKIERYIEMPVLGFYVRGYKIVLLPQVFYWNISKSDVESQNFSFFFWKEKLY